MRLTSIVPHGDIPDRRGFAPSIVAQELVRRMRLFTPSFVALNENEGASHEWWDNMEVRRYKVGSFYRRLFTKITRLDPYPIVDRIVPLTARLDPDIVHVHQLEFPVEKFRKKLNRRLPVVTHVHSMRSFDPRRGVASAYIAVCEYTRRIMCEQRGFPEPLVHVIHNGVDEHLFRPPLPEERIELRSLLGIPRDGFVLGYVGRRQEAKGYHDYLCMMERLVARHDHVFGIVVGPEPGDARRDATHEASRGLLNKMTAEGRIIDLRAMTHDRLCHLYRAMDMVVSISRGEQFPVMLVEAMSSGCVVVATPVGGIPELVRDGGNGLLLSLPIDDEELDHRVAGLISDPEEMKRLSENARDTVINGFSWNQLSRKFEALVMSLLQEREVA